MVAPSAKHSDGRAPAASSSGGGGDPRGDAPGTPLGRLLAHNDIVFALGIATVLATLLIPMPTFLMDMLLAVFACSLDDEPLAKAWRIVPMRLIYRPLLSWVVWSAIIKAFKGAWVTWGKLERTASVEVKVS